jgi:hypothetical protein
LLLLLLLPHLVPLLLLPLLLLPQLLQQFIHGVAYLKCTSLGQIQLSFQ